MNKSHITDEQVKIVLQMYWHADNPSKIFSNVDIQDMRRSLEAAFPEKQPAAIKPIAFSDRMPEEGESILCWNSTEKLWALGEFRREWLYESETHWLPASALPIPEPVAVDAKEAAWNLYRVSNEVPNGATLAKQDFLAGYEAAQANNIKSTKD